MATPRNPSDLFLAPLLIRLDQELDEFAGLSRPDLDYRIVLETNALTNTPGLREQALTTALAQIIDTHDWQLEIVGRGLRVSHGGNHVTLGLPESVRVFLAEPAAT
ncbi:MAG: hypothetical protein PSX37_04505 [bacterium]|nr:hypothetical protein [bacterium]